MPLLGPIRAGTVIALAVRASACSESTEPEVPTTGIDSSAVPGTIGVGDSLQVPVSVTAEGVVRCLSFRVAFQ